MRIALEVAECAKRTQPFPRPLQDEGIRPRREVLFGLLAWKRRTNGAAPQGTSTRRRKLSFGTVKGDVWNQRDSGRDALRFFHINPGSVCFRCVPRRKPSLPSWMFLAWWHAGDRA